MSSDRDRLIELVCKGIQEFGKSTVKCSIDEYLADYLLANGVIVPVRCKDCEYYTPIIQASAKWKSKTFYCTRNANMKMNEDDYCSCAKLKEREG